MFDIDMDEVIKTPWKKRWKRRNSDIYERFKNGETVEQLCEAYNLSNSRVNEIIRQFSWKDLKKTTHTETGKPNMLVPNIMDLDISAKTRNKLMRIGIMYIKQLNDRMPELRRDRIFGDKVLGELQDIVDDYYKYKIDIKI